MLQFPDFYFEMPAMPVKPLEPLVDEKHAVSDPEIVGKWVWYPGPGTSAPYLLEIKEVENVPNNYAVTFSPPGGKSAYNAKIGRWEKQEFADVESVSAAQTLDPVPAHSFWRIQHDGGFLWLAYMGSDWAEKHIPKRSGANQSPGSIPSSS